jgi:hypothetical protein
VDLLFHRRQAIRCLDKVINRDRADLDAIIQRASLLDQVRSVLVAMLGCLAQVCDGSQRVRPRLATQTKPSRSSSGYVIFAARRTCSLTRLLRTTVGTHRRTLLLASLRDRCELAAPYQLVLTRNL